MCLGWGLDPQGQEGLLWAQGPCPLHSCWLLALSLALSPISCKVQKMEQKRRGEQGVGRQPRVAGPALLPLMAAGLGTAVLHSAAVQHTQGSVVLRRSPSSRL